MLVGIGGSSDAVSVASNPEFLREGHAVHDFLNPNRIVIGCDDPESAVRVSHLLASVEAPMLVTDPVRRDDQVRVERIPRDQDLVHQRDRGPVELVDRMCSRSPSVWDTTPASVRSSCTPDRLWRLMLPEGTAALVHRAQSVGYDFQLLDSVTTSIPREYDRMVGKVRRAVGGTLQGAVVGVWGLTLPLDEAAGRRRRGDDDECIAGIGIDCSPCIAPGLASGTLTLASAGSAMLRSTVSGSGAHLAAIGKRSLSVHSVPLARPSLSSEGICGRLRRMRMACPFSSGSRLTSPMMDPPLARIGSISIGAGLVEHHPHGVGPAEQRRGRRRRKGEGHSKGVAVAPRLDGSSLVLFNALLRLS